MTGSKRGQSKEEIDGRSFPSFLPCLVLFFACVRRDKMEFATFQDNSLLTTMDFYL